MEELLMSAEFISVEAKVGVGLSPDADVVFTSTEWSAAIRKIQRHRGGRGFW